VSLPGGGGGGGQAWGGHPAASPWEFYQDMLSLNVKVPRCFHAAYTRTRVRLKPTITCYLNLLPFTSCPEPPSLNLLP
jgi:hypothetical protein